MCWSSLERMPALPAHTTLSQAKYIALLRWLMVRQSLSTLSERWIALLAACSASTEFPRRKTVTQQTPVTTQFWCFFVFVLFFKKDWLLHSRFLVRLMCASSWLTVLWISAAALALCRVYPRSVHAYWAALLIHNTLIKIAENCDVEEYLYWKLASTLKVWKWHCLIKPNESRSMSIIHNWLLEETENSFLHLTCQIETKSPRLWQHLIYACMTRSHICVNALAEMEMA